MLVIPNYRSTVGLWVSVFIGEILFYLIFFVVVVVIWLLKAETTPTWLFLVPTHPSVVETRNCSGQRRGSRKLMAITVA